MNKLTIIGFASTRSVQIAATYKCPDCGATILCLHTLRADCSATPPFFLSRESAFASTRSVQIAAAEMHRMHMHFLERVLSW